MQKQYKVITSGSPQSLASKVNELIRDGWQAIGGVCFSNPDWAQAVIKTETVISHQYNGPD